MSLLQGFEEIRLVKVGPSWRERFDRWLAAEHHQAVVGELQRFREHMERDMQPESWAVAQAPMVLLLGDLCDALALTAEERAQVLGPEGDQVRAELLETRLTVRPEALLNERQTQALAHAREHGLIDLGAYRRLCPGWSDETLRLDLSTMAKWGLLVKNGHKKGRYYTPAARVPVHPAASPQGNRGRGGEIDQADD